MSGSGKVAGTVCKNLLHEYVGRLAGCIVKKEKIDQQPNDVLLALQRQLLAGQLFQKLEKKGISSRPIRLQD